MIVFNVNESDLTALRNNTSVSHMELLYCKQKPVTVTHV